MQAALQGQRQGVQHRSRIQILVDSIVPAIEGVDADLPPQAQLACAVEANVRWQFAAVRDSPEAQARLAAGGFMLLGAIYDIATGQVRWLDSEG